MTSPILITGGTGTLGGHVVPLLREAGRDLRVLSRRPREPGNGIRHVAGDLLAGTGLAPAVEGVQTVVHLAGGPKGDDEATRNLVLAAERAGVRHLVYISVIAADQVPLGYFKAKLGAEKAIAESGIPFSILRAAQFHDLVFTVVQKMARMPLIPVPGGLRFQPVDARDVAARLAEMALDGPAGRVADLAGPRVYGMGELADSYLQAGGRHRMKMPVRMPGKAGRAYRAGDNLNLRTAARGKRTWEVFLAEKLSGGAQSAPTDRGAERAEPQA